MNKKRLFLIVALLPLLVAGILPLLAQDEPPCPPLPPPGAIVVEIDIKPGSYPNSIHLGANGLVPVGILSGTVVCPDCSGSGSGCLRCDNTGYLDFDATSVDPATVLVAGNAYVAVRGNGKKDLVHDEDVDGLGLLDRVLQVETENLRYGEWQDGYMVLVGNIGGFGGPLIWGYDEITIVPQ